MILKAFLPPTFRIGFFTFHIYGFLIGLSAVIVMWFVNKKYGKVLKTSDYFLVLILTLAGARLVYALNNINAIINNPLVIFAVNSGGLALHGAILGIVVSVIIISKIRRIKFLELSDKVLAILPLAQSIGRWGNFFNNELYGKPTNLPWKLFIPSENRLPGYSDFDYFHPTFLYESILDLILFFTLLSFYKRKGLNPGVITFSYLIGYGVIRLIMNYLRIDKVYFIGIETSDIYSVLMIVLGLTLLVREKLKTIKIKNQST